MPTSAAQTAQRLAQDAGGRYDRVIRLAQAIFGAPIVALNLIGDEFQYTVAAVGIRTGATPVDQAICRTTVTQQGVFEVHDLRDDARFKDLPLVAEPPRLRYYAGVPLRTQAGQTVGALCILDFVPRELGRSQREMLADLGTLLEREMAVQEEMAKAGEVQQRLLPRTAPDIPGVEIAGRVVPYRDAGGDFFDWQVVDGDDGGRRLQVLLSDVMGKGLAAALIASVVRAALRTHSRYTGLADAVQRTAETTAPDLESNERFVTMWAARIDPVTGAVQYVDAGHGLAVIVSPTSVRRLVQDHLPLGMPIADTWTMAEDVLAYGERIVIVSDGVFDVFPDDESAMAAVQMTADPDTTNAEMVDTIVAYASDHGSTDDVTAIVISRTSGGAGASTGTNGQEG